MLWYWVLAVGLVVVAGVLHWSGVVVFNTPFHWSTWVVIGLVILNGGWMAFDGGRALIVSDYVTPKEGRLAGTLGPWSKVAEAVGIPARSKAMKSIFLVYGLVYLGVTLGFVLGASWAWTAMLIVAVLGLWYVPFGTLINGIVIVLLLLTAVRR